MNSNVKNKLFLVRADEEYGSEKFWDALSQRQDLARINRCLRDGKAIVSGSALQALRLLPEFGEGPAHAVNALLAEEITSDWLTIDGRVSIKYNDRGDGDFVVSCLDTEEDADDGHAEDALAKVGLRLSLTGNGDSEGDQYVERIGFAEWELV